MRCHRFSSQLRHDIPIHQLRTTRTSATYNRLRQRTRVSTDLAQDFALFRQSQTGRNPRRETYLVHMMKLTTSSTLFLSLLLAVTADAFVPLCQGILNFAIAPKPTSSTMSATKIEPCPPGSSNCIRTVWTAPKGTSKQAIIKTVKSVLDKYPQEGQAGVDKGGWTLVQDSLSSSGTARVEFKSGSGIFAKLVNGGKPFIDDLVMAIDGNSVQVRSSSRIGQSDLGVNKKRLQFFASALRSEGWDAPEPKY